MRLAEFAHLGYPLFLSRHRHLALQLARRDVLARYKGSVLGLAWGLLFPLLILLSYTFVFRTVFKARWPGGADSTLEFALNVFAGLVVFNLFGDLLNRAPRLVLEQPNLVKRVVFPLEILPWVALGAAFFHTALSLVILVAAVVVGGSGLSQWALLTPLVFAAMLPMLLALGWLLAALGVFIRDIGHAMGPVVTMLMFLSPVLYPASALPDFVRPLLWLNPLTVPIESLRALLLQGRAPDWAALGVYTLVGLALAVAGWRLFDRLKPAFADEV